MNDALRSGFQLDEWRISPMEGKLNGPAGQRHLRPRVMDVLLCLAGRAGEVVSRDEIASAVWGDRAAISDEPLTRAIADLRQALGDRRDKPRYIETIPKRGYRLIAEVRLDPEIQQQLVADASPTSRRSTFMLAAVALAAVLLTLIAVWLIGSRELTPEAPTATATRPAIAVLPFSNLSADTRDEYFSDGLSETLAHVLAQVDDLKVIARTSAFMFKNRSVDVREIGEQLGVDAVLEGSVQRGADSLRIVTQLVSTRDGSRIWTQRFDRAPADVFAIQDEIAASVAAALQVTLVDERRDRSVRLAYATDNLPAYEAYLEGRRSLVRRTSASLAAAIGHFRRALDHDADYSLAWVGLADAHILLREYGNLSREQMEEQARPAIARALELDPELGEAYASTGLLLWAMGDNAGAEAALERAIVLEPNYSQAYFWLGTVYNNVDRPEQALTMHRTALGLDPLAPAIHNAVAVSLEKLGRFDEAREQFRHVTAIDPGYAATLDRAARLHWTALAEPAEAIRLQRCAIAADPGYPISPALLVELMLDLGHPQDAQGWIARALDVGADTAWPARAEAMLLAYHDEDAARRLELGNAWAPVAHDSESREILLRIARDVLLQRGAADQSVALYRQAFPQFAAESPAIDSGSLGAAVDLVYALEQSGESAEAERLRAAASALIAELPRLGCCGYGIADAELQAMGGNDAAALTLLEDAASAGWRRHWWLDLAKNPVFASLADTPRFAALTEALQRELGAQPIPAGCDAET